jgi:hypothetical protein
MASTGLSSSAQEGDVASSPADVVVAVTSRDDVRTIETVARGLQEGVSRYAPSSSVRYVLADAGSTDGTREVARDILGPRGLVELPPPAGGELLEMPYHGQPQRAATLRAILQLAQQLEAKVCAVIDANRQAAGPEIIGRLIGPVLSDRFDYVSPYYVRHVNEGAITRAIIYPVFRALYGVRLRQPTAGEFACSGRLLAHYLEQDFWEVEHASVGIDLWFAVAAVAGEFRVCEAALGLRGATPREGLPNLSTTLAQLVNALFTELEYRFDFWQRVRGSTEVPVVGVLPAIASEGPPLDLEALMRSFRLGYRELREIWTYVLPPRTIVELRRLADAPADRFAFDDRLWATIVYDFAFGYGMRIMPRDHLLRSLTPLYSAWLASFARQMHGATVGDVEERLERLCMAFEAEKRYLISRWRWPERLR